MVPAAYLHQNASTLGRTRTRVHQSSPARVGFYRWSVCASPCRHREGMSSVTSKEKSSVLRHRSSDTGMWWRNGIGALGSAGEHIVVYTDGSVRADGSLSAAWFHPDSGCWEAHASRKTSSSAVSSTEAELRAVIDAIRISHPHSASVRVRTDCQTIALAWARWCSGDKMSAFWRDMCQRIVSAASNRLVVITWVRGHAKDQGNRFTDRLAFHSARAVSGDISTDHFAHISTSLAPSS
jgi:ribonuclease HI